MISIFRFPGGKTKKAVRERILAKAPYFQEYREPFLGGGGIFFAVDTYKRRWINDIDNNLMEVYLALKDRPDHFIAACRVIDAQREGEPLAPARPGGEPRYNARLKKHFDFFAKNETCYQALRYLFVNRTVWAGRVNYDLESRIYFSNPEGWNLVKTNRLEQAAECCKDATITVGSYDKLLREPGEDVWIYADPPYLVNTHLSKTSQLYRHGFTEEDHERFAEEVKRCPHKVCISYDDDDRGFIRSLHRGFDIFEESWTYSGTSSAKSDRSQENKKKKGRELVICNYTPSGMWSQRNNVEAGGLVL